jgi:hypothetical protein
MQLPTPPNNVHHVTPRASSIASDGDAGTAYLDSMRAVPE